METVTDLTNRIFRRVRDRGKDKTTLKVTSQTIIREKCNPNLRFKVKAFVPSGEEGEKKKKKLFSYNTHENWTH
jgi:hypothetical protein